MTFLFLAAYLMEKEKAEDFRKEYMSGSMPYFMNEEDSVRRDLEYLQQLYPAQVKRLQTRVSDILDKMDYEGSLIYDEYPDKWQLYRLKDSVVTVLRQEESREDEEALGEEAVKEDAPEKWEWIGDMVQVLIYYEIYRRRHGGRRGFLKF